MAKHDQDAASQALTSEERIAIALESIAYSFSILAMAAIRDDDEAERPSRMNGGLRTTDDPPLPD
jgi:hypothetical protein